MKQALYEGVLEDAFKYETLAWQAEASGDDELAEFFRQMRDENRRCTERTEQLLVQRLPE